MKPTLAVAHLDGKTTWKQARNKGADACLFVTKIPVEGSLGEAVGFAFLVNGGKMTEAEAQTLLKQAMGQYGTKLFAYLNLMDIEETAVSHTEGPLGSFVAKAFVHAMETTGVTPKFQQMCLSSTNPGIDSLLRQMGIKA